MAHPNDHAHLHRPLRWRRGPRNLHAAGVRWSGKEVRLPEPPPLRTARAGFLASSSSIGQRTMGARGCPIGLGDNLDVTVPGPATEMMSVAEAAPAKIVTISPTDLRRLLRWFADRSRPPTPEGSLPGFPWGDVATPIRSITDRPSFSPASCPRSPIGCSYEPPTPRGGLRAYHVPLTQPSGLGRVSGPVARHLRQGNAEAPAPGHLPFWFKPSSSFRVRYKGTTPGLSNITALATLHLG